MRFVILSYSEKLWKFFEIVLEKCEAFVQKSLWLKKYFERKHSQALVCSSCVNLPTVKICMQSDKFPVSLSSLTLQWPLQVKKLIRAKTALNISIRRVTFTSGQNLKPRFLCLKADLHGMTLSHTTSLRHNHIRIAKYVFSTRDELYKNLGDNLTVLAREMLSSGCRPRLKNARA